MPADETPEIVTLARVIAGMYSPERPGPWMIEEDADCVDELLHLSTVDVAFFVRRPSDREAAEALVERCAKVSYQRHRERVITEGLELGFAWERLSELERAEEMDCMRAALQAAGLIDPSSGSGGER